MIKLDINGDQTRVGDHSIYVRMFLENFLLANFYLAAWEVIRSFSMAALEY